MEFAVRCLSRKLSYQLRCGRLKGLSGDVTRSPSYEEQKLGVLVQIHVLVSWLVRRPSKSLEPVILQDFKNQQTRQDPIYQAVFSHLSMLSLLSPRTLFLISEVTVANLRNDIGIPG